MNKLDILFVHNNFPAQFRNLAARMARQSSVRVRAIGARLAPGLSNIDIQRYSFSGQELSGVHAFARRFELECRRAEQVIYAANALKMDGFSPQLIYVHPGWGEALPLRTLFPDATIGVYAEFYYWPHGSDVGFDKEFPQYGVDGQTRVVLRNAAMLLAMTEADFAVAPTLWQRSVFPPELHPKIHTIHDGLDFNRLTLVGTSVEPDIASLRFNRHDEVVTFVTRNLEPYRGFHIFMRALPDILRARPNARICILGGDRVSYGASPIGYTSWREAMLDELGNKLDMTRVHFMGTLSYHDYLTLLWRSNVHVYLTYPFVLSWSMLEAMAMECLVVGSATPPVEEIIRDRVNGLLVPFFDVDALTETVIRALQHPEDYREIRREARRHVLRHYDFARISWPAHLKILENLGLSMPLIEALKAA